MSRTLRVLYLAGGVRGHDTVEAVLLREFDGVELSVFDSLDAFVSAVAGLPHDIELADYHLRGATGIDAWNLLDHRDDAVPFVVLLDEDVAEVASIDAMRSGVSECVYAEDFPRLGYVVSKLLELWEARQARMQADAALEVSRNQLLRLTQQLHAKVDEERAAVSREIHDDIGGALAAVKFDLAWISRRTTDPDVKERVAQAVTTLQQALDASQRIMLNLRPAILDEGLVPALQWLVSTFQKRTGAEVLLRCSNDSLELSAEVQTVAFSVVRESLTNVVKHAQATRVVVDVSDQEGMLTVEVSDNGIGLAPKALSKATSFGILGLRERAQSVGGWLDVSSSERGVSVILSVPLDSDKFNDMAELIDDQRGGL